MRTGSRTLSAALVAALLAPVACAPVAVEGGSAVAARPTSTASGADRDTTALIPTGFGTLRQDDLAIRITVQGLTVRAIPLDENFIRTLSPDSYRALRDIGESKREDVDAIVRRTGLPAVSVWYVSFFNLQQGEARFTAQDVVLTNMGRDFRPVDIVPLTPAFGSQRLRQREQAHALYVFDGAINANQNIALTLESQSGGDWRSVIQRVERERALIRSRASAGQRPPPER
jgi:hypothetical protein